MRFTATTLLVALAAAPFTSALGINCRGSQLCGLSSLNTMRMIRNSMASIPRGTTFTNGEQIKCYNDICAFLRNVQGSKTIEQIQGYVTDLINHGCHTCGSDPTEPGNDVSKGELTVNLVPKPHA